MKADNLKKFNGEIEGLKEEIETIDGKKMPFVESIRHRVYWVEVFNFLGKKMDSDVMFMTVLEPLADGQPVIPDQDGGLITVADGSEAVIDSFEIKGLWRENPRGPEVVYDYFKRLKEDAESESGISFFDLKDVDIGEMVTVTTGSSNDRYAYDFKMVLPLPEANQVKFTK